MNTFSSEATRLNDEQEIILGGWLGADSREACLCRTATVKELHIASFEILRGVDLHRFDSRFGVRKVLKKLAKKGLVKRISKNRFFLTDSGLEYINNVFGEECDLAWENPCQEFCDCTD